MKICFNEATFPFIWLVPVLFDRKCTFDNIITTLCHCKINVMFKVTNLLLLEVNLFESAIEMRQGRLQDVFVSICAVSVWVLVN